jgi:hypothetical protein
VRSGTWSIGDGRTEPELLPPTIPLVNAPLDMVVGNRARLAPGSEFGHPARALSPLSPLPPPVTTNLSDGAPTADVLSTGIYLSGNAGLEIGACYALSRVGDRWRVFGPVDAGQITIRHEGRLDTLDVTAMEDRVVLSAIDGRSSLAIVMRPIGGMRADALERALAPDPSAGPGARGVAS